MREKLREGWVGSVAHCDFGQELEAYAELQNLTSWNDPIAPRSLNDRRQIVVVLELELADLFGDWVASLIRNMGERQAVGVGHLVAFR